MFTFGMYRIFFSIVEGRERENKKSGWKGLCGLKNTNLSRMACQHRRAVVARHLHRGRQCFGDTTTHERSDADAESRPSAAARGRATTGRRSDRLPRLSLNLHTDTRRRQKGAEGCAARCQSKDRQQRQSTHALPEQESRRRGGEGGRRVRGSARVATAR